MDHKEVQMMAAEFVLGTLNRAMLLQFKDELTQNPALREAVKDWERRFGVERVAVTPPAKAADALHQAHRRAIGHAVATPESTEARKPKAPTIEAQTAKGRIGTEPSKAEQSRAERGKTERRDTKQSKTLAPSHIRRSAEPLRETPVIPGAREIPVSFDAPASSGSKAQEAEAVLDVQAALDQISLDNSLASRARCGLNSRRLPSASGTAKRALPVGGKGGSGSAALKEAPAPQETALPRTDSALELDPVQKADPADKETEVSPAPSEPQAGSKTPEASDKPGLSKAQAARKAETVLKAAQNLLTKARGAKERAAAPREAPAPELPSPLRAEEGEWEAMAPRIYKKLLHRDDKANRQSYLLRMIPGGRIPPQTTDAVEEVFVIEGLMELGGRRLGPGDFQAFPAERPPIEILAAGDSLLLVRGLIADHDSRSRGQSLTFPLSADLPPDRM